jgi:hypothetical protein
MNNNVTLGEQNKNISTFMKFANASIHYLN